MARTMRHWAVPSDLRDAKNPLPLTPEVLAEGARTLRRSLRRLPRQRRQRADGDGPNDLSEGPDMTLAATQSLSDGELFAIIENGVRLTGMPGFGNGTAESAYGSWALVHFIRHLPKLTAEEIAEMEKLNPEVTRRVAADAGRRKRSSPAKAKRPRLPLPTTLTPITTERTPLNMRKFILFSLLFLLAAATPSATPAKSTTYMGTVTALHDDGSFMLKKTDGKTMHVLVSAKTVLPPRERQSRDARRSHRGQARRRDDLEGRQNGNAPSRSPDRGSHGVTQNEDPSLRVERGEGGQRPGEGRSRLK